MSMTVESLSDFQEVQWWLQELDAMVANGTPDQKRAVAVVRNLMRTAHRHIAAGQKGAGCGACGDGCKDRGSCRLADESPKPAGHVLYEQSDTDAPDSIKDRNGDITLALCRNCGRGEADLIEPCFGYAKPAADVPLPEPAPSNYPNYSADDMRAYGDAREAAARDAGRADAVPEGYVLAPFEPTETMIDEAADESVRVYSSPAVPVTMEHLHRQLYKAMIRVSPFAPQCCGDCEGEGRIATGEIVNEADDGWRTCKACNGEGSTAPAPPADGDSGRGGRSGAHPRGLHAAVCA